MREPQPERRYWLWRLYSTDIFGPFTLTEAKRHVRLTAGRGENRQAGGRDKYRLLRETSWNPAESEDPRASRGSS